ncbi:metal ABC transporter permease [Otariodibacter oris]|uniref:Manganese/iron transport system permease protein n=1 Tax=Otariodibacter oris TaxID=1032623 RepID=A0A420XGQ5_9PAST|nr:metal ABC transporter permease [Otariodibacter oris]QGM81147.1 iron ABC transporter permease [Otariodibacter oris]RKR72700.1 manganese/iron transport system permease protein [Otariodibacter oris]
MFDILISWFTEPLAYGFMQQALIISLIVGVVCATLSCYLVLKGWSLMGDAISHAVLPGIVLAYVVSLPLAVGAFVSGIFCSVAVGYLKENSRIKEDTVMGIVFSGMFAFGIVLFTKVQSDQHLLHILFGNILGISEDEFQQTLLIALISLAVILLKRKDLLLYCFDPSHARTIGLNVKLLHYGLLVLLALVIISAMQVVGVILVVAMLITPGITGYVLAKRFDYMLLIAICTSLFSGVVGVLMSFHFNVATGPSVVLLQAVCFIVAFAISKVKSRLVVIA